MVDDNRSEEEDNDETRFRSDGELPLEKYIYRFILREIILKFFIVLLDYKVNPNSLNKAIIDIFNYMAKDLKHYPMFFQLSHLRIIHHLMINTKSVTKYKPINEFCGYISKAFVNRAKENPSNIFLNALFKLSRKDSEHYSELMDFID